MPTCFVMMPLSTPAATAAAYGNNTNHFTDVYNSLFVPAIKDAGYEPIDPRASGSDIIHARIISSIRSADMVLCDISTHNANVFFELGIRTALNLPAIVVKDEQTLTVPFDTGIINHHTYKLTPFNLKKEIGSLAQHIVASSNDARQDNALWRYFGLASSTNPLPAAKSADDKLDYALELLKSIKQEPATTHVSDASPPPGTDPETFVVLARSMAGTVNARIVSAQIDGNKVRLDFGDYRLPKELVDSIAGIAVQYGVHVQVVGIRPPL